MAAKHLNSKSFTLIETVMTMVILSLLIGLTAVFSYMLLDTLSTQTRQANLKESANVALARMSRFLRAVKNDTSFYQADDDAIWVRVNLTAGQPPLALDTGFRYDQSGTTLRECPLCDEDLDPTYVLTGHLEPTSGLTFAYYDDDGNDVTGSAIAGGGTRGGEDNAKTNIRRIDISLTLEDGSHAVNAETSIRPRNLRHESYLFD